MALPAEGVSRGMLRVGLTGGVASGKSTVARVFRRQGAVVIDADVLARRLVRPGGEVWRKIVACFGEEVLREDGAIDRPRLAGIVFSDPEKRQVLEGILHPPILHLARRVTAKLGRLIPGAVVVWDFPLLFEAGLQAEMDKIVVVACSDDLQLKRLMLRDGLSEAEARARICAQWPLERKMAQADFVIRNEGSLAEVWAEASQVFEQLQQLSRKRH